MGFSLPLTLVTPCTLVTVISMCGARAYDKVAREILTNLSTAVQLRDQLILHPQQTIFRVSLELLAGGPGLGHLAGPRLVPLLPLGHATHLEPPQVGGHE